MSTAEPKKGTRDFSFSRVAVECALTVYIENGLSVKNPVQCLEISATGSEAQKWMLTHGYSVQIVHSNTNTNGCHQEAKDLNVNSNNNYALIENTDFNFIYVECTTEGSSYFDCVFRKIARNGLFALSTSDDPALYGRPADPALRCYSGLIIRTFYAPEMALRLILAAMARSAARFSKSIDVLLAFAIKNTITILVKVKKGAEVAVKCLREVRTLLHCTVCEERAFLPDNDGFVVGNVQQYLSCECAVDSVGRTMMALGPLWAGSLGSPAFVSHLLPHIPSLQLSTFLQNLIIELRCDDSTARDESQRKAPAGKSSCEGSKKDVITDNPPPVEDSSLKRKLKYDECELKRKLSRLQDCEVSTAPVFYYNLHKHKPKGTQKLLKVDKTVELLHRLGYRASRTHFDRAAVKTNATLSQLHSVLSQFI